MNVCIFERYEQQGRDIHLSNSGILTSPDILASRFVMLSHDTVPEKTQTLDTCEYVFEGFASPLVAGLSSLEVTLLRLVLLSHTPHMEVAITELSILWPPARPCLRDPVCANKANINKIYTGGPEENRGTWEGKQTTRET